MTDKKNENKKHQKHNDIEDAPESGTVVHEENPSKPEEAENDQPKDSIGEAPESGTIRERK